MIDLRAIERAGRVRRWHTNPDLCHTDDPTSHHAGRVARIILALWPDATGDLLKAALIHDDGEAGAWGDVPAPAKAAMPSAVRDGMNEAEFQARYRLWGRDFMLCETDRKRLQFADRLDAYMWAQRHAPAAVRSDAWVEDRIWVAAEAGRLGVWGPVCGVLDGVA